MSATAIVILLLVVLLTVMLFKTFRVVFKLLLWAIVIAAIYWVAAPMLGWKPLPDILHERGLPVPAFMERDRTIPANEVPIADPAAPISG